jgi:hypothetical protein
MEQNDRPLSPLMRRLQEALDKEAFERGNSAVQMQPTVPSAAAPAQRLPSPMKPAPFIPPERPVQPSFTSAAITQGDYHQQANDAALDAEIAADDLTEQELTANSRSRYAGLILATAIILAGSAALATFMIFLSPPKEATGPVPEIRAEQSPAKTTAEAAPSAPVSMGDVSSELVPPSTDGLSPARRISTTRILLDGDKEIRP